MKSVSLILFTFAVIEACSGLLWTSSSVLPPGSVVYACSGGDVTMAWNYQTEGSEHDVDVEWSFQRQGEAQSVVVATYVNGGSFVVAPNPIRNVSFVPDAGIRLTGVTSSDSGLYTVKVNVNLQGSIVSHSQNVTLQVDDIPPISGQPLKADMAPEAVFNAFTKQWNVLLICGSFSSSGPPSGVDVVWMTPDNKTLPSSSYINGSFLLFLPENSPSGDYACALSGPSASCLQGNDSRFPDTSSVIRVGSTKVQLAIKSAQLKQQSADLAVATAEIQRESVELSTRLAQLEMESAQLTAMEKENKRLRSDLEQEKRNNVILTKTVQELKGNCSERFDSCWGIARDCEEARQTNTSSGVRTLCVDGVTFDAFCDQDTDGGGWTVFQRRIDGSVDFFRNWTEYEEGFGDLGGEYWLGLKYIYLMTIRGDYSLRIELEDFNGTTAYAGYQHFFLTGPRDNYRLHVTGYNGTANDSLSAHGYGNQNLQMFSTWDEDHDAYYGHCNLLYHSAGWSNKCFNSNLNGRYKPDGEEGMDGVTWYYLHGDYRSLKRVEMKIRPLNDDEDGVDG